MNILRVSVPPRMTWGEGRWTWIPKLMNSVPKLQVAVHTLTVNVRSLWRKASCGRTHCHEKKRILALTAYVKKPSRFGVGIIHCDYIVQHLRDPSTWTAIGSRLSRSKCCSNPLQHSGEWGHMPHRLRLGRAPIEPGSLEKGWEIGRSWGT